MKKKQIKQLLAAERRNSPDGFWAQLSVAQFRRVQNRLKTVARQLIGGRSKRFA